MSERPHCPFCDSPDTAPYKFGDTPMGQMLKPYYPNAGVCMDCGVTFYDHERQRRIDFRNIRKTVSK